MRFTPRLIAVAGTPGSGKDELIRAVRDLGVGHASIVPKHTSRDRRPDDGDEMICPGDEGWALHDCDVTYDNFDDLYGIETSQIWDGLAAGVFQVLIVSGVSALNQLRSTFGGMMKCVYVHSELSEDEFQQREGAQAATAEDDYVARRVTRYWSAFEMYVANIVAFDHVLIHAGAPEDLFDQIFRLFRAYEHGELR